MHFKGFKSVQHGNQSKRDWRLLFRNENVYKKRGLWFSPVSRPEMSFAGVGEWRVTYWLLSSGPSRPVERQSKVVCTMPSSDLQKANGVAFKQPNVWYQCNWIFSFCRFLHFQASTVTCSFYIRSTFFFGFKRPTPRLAAILESCTFIWPHALSDIKKSSSCQRSTCLSPIIPSSCMLAREFHYFFFLFNPFSLTSLTYEQI